MALVCCYAACREPTKTSGISDVASHMATGFDLEMEPLNREIGGRFKSTVPSTVTTGSRIVPRYPVLQLLDYLGYTQRDILQFGKDILSFINSSAVTGTPSINRN